MVDIDARGFDELVADALDELPEQFTALLDNVVILVEDVHPRDDELLGEFDGIDQTSRDSDYTFELPDRITIYRIPLRAMCRDMNELRQQISITVVHEVAHHFGIDDDALHELGWG
jgi:predicted Zn-dependent protease with MMP-like domain